MLESGDLLPRWPKISPLIAVGLNKYTFKVFWWFGTRCSLTRVTLGPRGDTSWRLTRELISGRTYTKTWELRAYWDNILFCFPDKKVVEILFV